MPEGFGDGSENIDDLQRGDLGLDGAVARRVEVGIGAFSVTLSVVGQIFDVLDFVSAQLFVELQAADLEEVALESGAGGVVGDLDGQELLAVSKLCHNQYPPFCLGFCLSLA